MNIFSKFISVALLLCMQCKSVPLTERSQLSLISDAAVYNMSFDQYEQVKRESMLLQGTAEASMVKRVGTRVQKAIEQYFIQEGRPNYLSKYRWEFNLIKDDGLINAWCMPGGKIAFYTGIMPICMDETGVAVVMGHEIAHAIASHGKERMSQQMVAQLGASALQLAVSSGATIPINPDIFMQGVGAATSLGILAFSRKHESEADQLGLYFMAMAGYDPRQAPKFWERMSSGSGGSAPPEFLSTHPSHKTRINNLNQHMPKALEYFKQGK